MTAKTSSDLTLQQRCLHHILMHLEEFPANYLALLPLSLRRELLIKLPIADACLLEEGPFVQGIDMEEYWGCLIMWAQQVDKSEFSAKARCYGELASYIVHSYWRNPSGHSLHLRNTMEYKYYNRKTSKSGCCGEIVQFLFAVRQSKELVCQNIDWNCDDLFPPRYAQYATIYSTAELVKAVVHCFRGFPQLVNIDPFKFKEYEAQAIAQMDDIILEFLSKLTYICMESLQGESMESVSHGIDFVLALVEKNIKVQVLHMRHCQPVSLNKFFVDLSRSSFFTNLCLLKISSLCVSTDGTGFTVSEQILEEFLLAFLSAPCSHPQEIVFCGITVEDFTSVSCAVPFWHKLEGTNRHYLHLKTVRFEDSGFKMSRVTPKQVSNWAGVEVCENECIYNLMYCTSKVISLVFNGNRKRPCSEI